jgi:excisionase family DNA binding protein
MPQGIVNRLRKLKRLGERFSGTYTLTEAAFILGVSEKTVRNKVRRGYLEAIKDASGRVRISHSALTKYCGGVCFLEETLALVARLGKATAI